jgi:hypothetical protein
MQDLFTTMMFSKLQEKVWAFPDIHSPIRHHGVVLIQLSTGGTLPYWLHIQLKERSNGTEKLHIFRGKINRLGKYLGMFQYLFP